MEIANTVDALFSHYNYYASIAIMFVGLMGIARSDDMIRKLFGLGIFQSAIILFYVSMAFVKGGRPPLLVDMTIEYSYHSPLPHVLMLTAIVVGIATTAVALAIITKIHTIDSDTSGSASPAE